MSILELGALGEFVGSIGIIATLVYLAYQIRQNTASLQSTANHIATEVQTKYFDLFLTNPELRRIYNDGTRDLANLNPDERETFTLLMLKTFLAYAEGFYQYRHGYFDEEQWIALLDLLDGHLARQGVRDWWRHPSRRAFPREFTHEVDERLQRIEASAA